MTQEQVNNILTAICDEYDGKSDDTRPDIGIIHGTNLYTAIDATFPAWKLNDGILRCETSNGTRWVDVERISCIEIWDTRRSGFSD